MADRVPVTRARTRASDYTFCSKRGSTGYARADTGRSFNVMDNDGPNSGNVAEAYRTTPGTASASANTKLSNQITTTVGGGPVRFAFFTTPFMRVMTSTAGDEAVAELALTLSVMLGNDIIFTWSPCGNPSDASCFKLMDPHVSVAAVRDPFDLNQTIQCAGGV